MKRNTAAATAPSHTSAAWLGATLGLLLALVVFAPAAWLAQGLAWASQGQLLLADARGTVWNGSARLVLTGGTGSRDTAALPDRMVWRLRPSPAGLQASVQALCCSQAAAQVVATPRWNGLTLRVQSLALEIPAQLLTGLGTPWNTLAPLGQLQLRSDALTVDWNDGRTTLAGGATLDMTNISSRLSTLRPLGDYRFTLQGGSVPALQLQTLQGALQLTGNGQWIGSRLRFNGEASATPEREAALSNLLNIIGRRQGARSVISLG